MRNCDICGKKIRKGRAIVKIFDFLTWFEEWNSCQYCRKEFEQLEAMARQIHLNNLVQVIGENGVMG